MEEAHSFEIVVAAAENWGIGINGTIPWRIKEDLAFFKQVTTERLKTHLRKIVVLWAEKLIYQYQQSFDLCQVGAGVFVDYQEIPCANACFFREENLPSDVLVFDNLLSALTHVTQDSTLKEMSETVFVVGGGEIYREALNLTTQRFQPANQTQRSTFYCRRIYLTLVHSEPECDAFFPPLDQKPLSTIFNRIDSIEAKKHSIQHPSGRSMGEILEENGIKFEFVVFGTAHD